MVSRLPQSARFIIKQLLNSLNGTYSYKAHPQFNTKRGQFCIEMLLQVLAVSRCQTGSVVQELNANSLKHPYESVVAMMRWLTPSSISVPLTLSSPKIF